MKKVSVSFEWEGRTVALEETVEGERKFKDAVKNLLEESRVLLNPGTASPAQVRAFWAKASVAGIEKEQARSLLEEKFGTSRREELVGKVQARELSDLIKSISGDDISRPAPEEKPGMATVKQVRAFWGKALARGWDRAKVREFLSQRIGTIRDEEIIGKVAYGRFEDLIKEVAA